MNRKSDSKEWRDGWFVGVFTGVAIAVIPFVAGFLLMISLG